ncbi:MAG: hypothetical protein IK083_05775 [Abditibacteriota bacterium]|nr:hypothetical protein [Abditibacteriota bacterium]
MGKYDELFRAAEALKGDKLISERDEEGYYYTDAVKKFYDEVDKIGQLPDFCPGKDSEIVKRNGLKNVYTFDVSDKDAECVLAFLVYIYRGERFMDELTIDVIKEGVIGRAIDRLKELDAEEKA